MELEVIICNLTQLTKHINNDILNQKFDPKKIYITDKEPRIDNEYNIFINLSYDKNYMGQALYLYATLLPYTDIGDYLFNYYTIKQIATSIAIY